MFIRRRRFGVFGFLNIFAVLIVGSVVFVAVFLPMLKSRFAPPASVPAAISSDQATIQQDLATMTKAFAGRLSAWEATSDTTVHHVRAQDAGLPADFNTKEVAYGHCQDNGFYAIVLNDDPGTNLDGSADSTGYEYTPGGNPSTCKPVGWLMTSVVDVGSSWYYINIDTKAATEQPSPTGIH